MTVMVGCAKRKSLSSFSRKSHSDCRRRQFATKRLVQTIPSAKFCTSWIREASNGKCWSLSHFGEILPRLKNRHQIWTFFQFFGICWRQSFMGHSSASAQLDKLCIKRHCPHWLIWLMRCLFMLSYILFFWFPICINLNKFQAFESIRLSVLMEKYQKQKPWPRWMICSKYIPLKGSLFHQQYTLEFD